MNDMTNIVERLRGWNRDSYPHCWEAAAEIERLRHNRNTLAQAAALQAQRTDALERKGESFTKALLSAMSLVDQLLQENVRLCAASNEPPPIQLFAAKNSFDTAMKKLLGDVN
jgi:beta-phosphoglucomutase-like phosphatase (HAD superfamily)